MDYDGKLPKKKYVSFSLEFKTIKSFDHFYEEINKTSQRKITKSDIIEYLINNLDLAEFKKKYRIFKE